MSYTYFESNYTRALDEVLKAARSGRYEFAPWIPFIEPTGFGKTAAISSWLEHNKLKNVTIDATWCTPKGYESEYLPCDDLGPEPSVMIVGPEEMKKMFTPVKEVVNVVFGPDTIDSMDGSVIFIDNYSWASKEQRDELFKLIAYHQVTDLRSEHPHKLKTVNPLMLVVAMDSWHVNDLTPEERKLFGIDEEDI